MPVQCHFKLIPLDPNIEQYQNGTNVPALAWKVILRASDPSDESTTDYDVSERLMSEPNIVDNAEYRENLTYINEIGLKLLNSDKFLTNESGTGKLDTDLPVEILIDGYFDIPDGANYLIRKFGGYLDRNRMKSDSVKGNIEISTYSYFGKADRMIGLNLVTRYLDDNGLRVNKIGIWVRDAAVSGYELQPGSHDLEAYWDGATPLAKLDDGDPVGLSFGSEFTLSNADDTQRLVIYFETYNFDASETRKTKLIVKEVEQYPYTFFWYVPLAVIVNKCFIEIGLTDIEIQNYEVDTFDGRKIISGVNRVDNSNEQFVPVAIEFNGNSKFYISGAFTGTPNKNQIWEYDRVTGIIRLIHETTLNDNTKYKLVFDENENVLLGFIDSVEGDDHGFIQKFIINESGASYSTLLDDSQFDFVNPYFRFHYSKFLKKFIYLGMNGSDKVVYELDLDGNVNVIATDNNLELGGCSFIYETGSTVDLYYIKNSAGTRKLYKRTYSGGWSESFVIDWFDQGAYNNWYGYNFIAESKVFITNFNESRFFDITGASFSSDVNPADTKIYSPFESNGKLFVMTHNTSNDVQKLASFESNVLSFESENIIQYNIIKTPADYGFQQLCKFYSLDLGILSRYPALLLRYSSKFAPFIEGEYDTSGQTIRDVLQELSTNFLGYVKVDAYKKGWFVSRIDYNSGSELALDKKYIKDRIGERINNEKFDRVTITNGLVQKSFGDTGIDKNENSLSLRLIPNDFVMDFAKYFHGYYQTRRKILRIKYLPTYYNFENLDKMDLSNVSMGSGIIHKVSPRKASCEFEVLVEE